MVVSEIRLRADVAVLAVDTRAPVRDDASSCAIGVVIMNYVKVGRSETIAEGALVPIEAAGLKLLATRLDDTIYVTQRKCPHLGFNLCKGRVEDRAVVCPLHRAKFNLETGRIERDPKLLFIGMKAKTDLRTYQVRDLDGDLYVAV